MNQICRQLKSLQVSTVHSGRLVNLHDFLPGLGGTSTSRSTFILKRKYPMRLNKEGKDHFKFKGINYVYELVEDTEIKPDKEVKVILKKFVEGVGQRGEVVSVKRNKAYNELLLTGLAEYATPEAIERANTTASEVNQEEEPSSPFAGHTARYLRNLVLSVVMSKDNEWTIQPWHIRVAFRKAGVWVPEECIEIPKKPIKGPDLNLEMKDFIVKVTINRKEEALVRCRLHHWSTSISNKLPFVEYPWTLKGEPIFPEDAEILQSLSLPKLKEEAAPLS